MVAGCDRVGHLVCEMIDANLARYMALHMFPTGVVDVQNKDLSAFFTVREERRYHFLHCSNRLGNRVVDTLDENDQLV